MATLVARISDLATRLSTEFNAVRSEITAGFASRPRGLSGFAGGKPDASEVLFAAVSPYAFTISQAKSSLRALTAATGSAVFTLKRTRSGTTVTVCTFTFSASGTLATVGAISNGSIIEGDLLFIEAPATPDATLAGLTALVREG